MNGYLDVHWESLNKAGEELCGDIVKMLDDGRRTIIVLSDGLGSGVKASILATLTAEIVASMWRERVALKDVVETVIATLPICSVRETAYATFTVAEIDRGDGGFRILNFDNPPALYIHDRKLASLERRPERIAEREVWMAEGKLSQGDMLAFGTDGTLNPSRTELHDYRWGWDEMAGFVEKLFVRRPASARQIVRRVVAQTRHLYRDNPTDDATVVAAYLRPRNALMVFTGPPLDPAGDDACAERVLNFRGRRVVCGGTTAEIVANYAIEKIETDNTTIRDEVPPTAKLIGVDLVTEGILTMARTLQYLQECRGDLSELPYRHNAAYLLARELTDADAIHFLVGQSVNPYYQNPQLPKSVSIRGNLVEQLAALLRTCKKEVTVELC